MLDRRIIGKNFPAVLNEVEKGAIRRFAESIGDPNPLYRDEKEAQSAGFRGLVAPPTFPATFTGGVDFNDVLNINERSTLVGEQSFEYHRSICAGDRLVVSSRVVDIYEKMGAGGVMDFAVIEDEGRDEQGELVFRSRRTIIVRPPMKVPEEESSTPPLPPIPQTL